MEKPAWRFGPKAMPQRRKRLPLYRRGAVSVRQKGFAGPFLPNYGVSPWLQQWAWKNLVRQFRSCIPCQQGNSSDSQLPRIGVLAELLGLVRQLAGIRMGREHRAVLRGGIHKFRKSGNCRRGRPIRDVL